MEMICAGVIDLKMFLDVVVRLHWNTGFIPYLDRSNIAIFICHEQFV